MPRRYAYIACEAVSPLLEGTRIDHPQNPGECSNRVRSLVGTLRRCGTYHICNYNGVIMDQFSPRAQVVVEISRNPAFAHRPRAVRSIEPADETRDEHARTLSQVDVTLITADAS